MEIIGVSDFDLKKIFECGQCFRWEADESGVYTGVAYGRAAALRQEDSRVFISGTLDDFNALWRGYFDLDRDYAKIRTRLNVSDFMRSATQFGTGIRILRQDAWEALCTFILSQNNNIPRIKRIVGTLCREFGDSLDFRGKTLYTFPSAERLSVLQVTDLAPLRCGYRARYVIEAAVAVATGVIDLDFLRSHSATDARTALKQLHGVGDKVANCVLLFGLHMLNSFPVDVWIKRAIEQYCGSDFDPSRFSPYAGIAQQYIFHYTRNG